METMVRETLVQKLLAEFHEETTTTRRALERIPADKLAWKPHPKSMSIGQLGRHLAMIPGAFARIVQQDTFDASQGQFTPPQPNNLAEIFAAYDESLRAVEENLPGMTDEQANATWTLMFKDKVLFSRPRIWVLRSVMLNHWYHHRGQLSVYLRLLDVPVPVTYGPTADENPFF